MNRALYHGTNIKTAEKIIFQQMLKSFGYLGVGVCLNSETALGYAKDKCRKAGLPETDARVLEFQLPAEYDSLEDSCECKGGGLALHDEIGRPLKQTTIHGAKILSPCIIVSGGSAAAAAGIANNNWIDAPIPLEAN